MSQFFPARESLGRDFAAGDGKIDYLFYSVAITAKITIFLTSSLALLGEWGLNKGKRQQKSCSSFLIFIPWFKHSSHLVLTVVTFYTV
jgi:hypothetical protein